VSMLRIDSSCTREVTVTFAAVRDAWGDRHRRSFSDSKSRCVQSWAKSYGRPRRPPVFFALA
jgi:hypothetical protein